MTKAKGQRNIKKRKSKARLPKAKTTGTDYWEWRRRNPYTSYLELPGLERIMEGGENTEEAEVYRDIQFCNEAIRIRELLLSADPDNHQNALTDCEKLIGQINPSTPDKPSTEIKYLVIFNDFACRLSIKLDQLPTGFMFARAAGLALHQMFEENWDLEEEPLASIATSALQAYDAVSLMLSEVLAHDDDSQNTSDGEESGVISDDDVELESESEDEGDEIELGEQAGNLTIRPTTPIPLPTIQHSTSNSIITPQTLEHHVT